WLPSGCTAWYRLIHDGREGSVGPRARLRDASRRQSLYPLGSIAPQMKPQPVAGTTGTLTSEHGDESTLQSQTQSKSVETQSQRAWRPGSLPAQTARTSQGRARPGQAGPQRGPSASASDREPSSGRDRLAQGGCGLDIPATLFGGGPHQFSRRLSRFDTPDPRPGHPESAVSTNRDQLGHPTLDRPYPSRPHAPGLASEPSPL